MKSSFLSLYDQVPLGFYIFSIQENKFTYANNLLLESLGYSLNEFLSLDPQALFPQKQQRQQFLELLKEKGRVHNHKSLWLGKDQLVLNFIESAAILDGHFEGFIHDISTPTIDSLSQKKNRYERLITDVIQTVHKSINFPDAIENIFDAIVNNIEKADTLSIYLIEGDFAVMKNRRGFPESFLSRAGRIPKPKGITWKVILEGKAYYSPDVETDPIAGPAASQMGVKSCYTLPLSINNEVIGALNIHCLRFKNAFDEDDLLTFWMLGSQIELALNNARQNELLSKSEEKYRGLFEDNPLMSFVVNAEGKVISINRAAEEELGYSREELLGKSVLEVFHPEERLQIQEQLQQCYENPKTLFSWQSRKIKKNGSLLDVREFSRAIHDLDGKVDILVMCENITEKIKIENKLRERQKLATIGEMAASIAHEINTPLGGIKMAADSLKRYFGHGPSLELLDMQDALIDQLKNIINPLLDFTRKTPLQKINHNVSSLLHLLTFPLRTVPVRSREIWQNNTI